MITSDRLKTTDDRNAAQVALYYRALEQVRLLVMSLDDADTMRAVVLAVVNLVLGDLQAPPAQVETPAQVDLVDSPRCTRCSVALDLTTGMSVVAGSTGELATVCVNCRRQLVDRDGWREVLRAKA